MKKAYANVQGCLLVVVCCVELVKLSLDEFDNDDDEDTDDLTTETRKEDDDERKPKMFSSSPAPL